MKTKIVEYGTQRRVTVVSASKTIITVVDDNGEGYFLIGHGLKTIPKEGDIGKITFIQNNTPFKGHWQYSTINL